MSTVLGFSEALVSVTACCLVFGSSTQPQSLNAGPAAAGAMLVGRLIIFLASFCGIFRYGSTNSLRQPHFFLRQLANTIPIVITSLTSLKVMGEDLPGQQAVLSSEGNILLLAVVVAVTCFFLDDESIAKPIQLVSLLCLGASWGSEAYKSGYTTPVASMGSALLIFIARDVALGKIFQSQQAEPLRRITLLVALILLWRAIG
jgi:hypothetical protein